MGIFIVILIVVLIALIVTLWIAIVLFYTRVPFVKTPHRNIGPLLREISLSERDVVYDLGCGDAHVLIAIEKASGAKTVGYEISPFAYCKAKWNVGRANAKTELHFQDFRNADIKNATVVFVFLITGVMHTTWEWLVTHAKPGTVIISYGFTFPDVLPERVIQTSSDSTQSKFNIYRTPS